MGITILGLLVGVGVPAFSDIIRNNRTAAQANELITALNVARSEATKLGMPVGICAADASHESCAGTDTADWKFGWLIFSDRTGDHGQLDDDDVLLQTSTAAGEGILLTSNDIGFARFGADGALLSPPITFNVRHTHCSGRNLRKIGVVASGRASLSKETCP